MADPKPAPKIMDVVHPGSVQPAPSGRPVIVSNRPYIKVDPMLNSDVLVQTADGQSMTDTRSSDKSMTVKPINGPDNLAQPVIETPVSEDGQSVTVAPSPEERAAAEPSVQKDAPEPAPIVEESSSGKSGEPIVGEPSEASTSSAEAMLAANILQAQAAVPAIDEEAAKAREDELEQLIAAKTYAVPINKNGRHKKIILLWMLVVLLLVIVMVDLLADMGVISLPFLPHTNFFGS